MKNFKYSASYRKATLQQKWEMSVRKTKGCWIWKGSLSQGYGHIKAKHKNFAAHRLGYELLIGEIPVGKVLDHLCRNRACVNPHHLEIVTHKINILRGVGRAAMEARMKSCINGHLLVGDNLYIRPKDGKRRCRLCNKRASKEWRERTFGLTKEQYLPLQEA